jgi:hypothetical protein
VKGANRHALGLWVFVGLWPLASGLLFAQEPAVVRVTAAQAAVRAEASEKAPVLDRVVKGAVFELISTEGDWFRIRLPADPRLAGARVTGYLSRKVAVQVSGTETAGAMTAARQPRQDPAGAGIKVGVDIGGQTSWLPASPVRAASVPGSAATLAAAAATAAFDASTPAAPAESRVTWVWGAAPGGSPPVMTGNRPSFFVAYTELADVNVSEVVPAIVRVAAGAGGWRVIGYSAGRPDAPARDDGSWVIVRDLRQDAAPSTLSGSGPGLVDIRPREGLAPGEYAVVLRPAVQKPYSGRELLGEHGIGRVFRAAWVFRIR